MASARTSGPKALPPKWWVSCEDVLEPTQRWDSGPQPVKMPSSLHSPGLPAQASFRRVLTPPQAHVHGSALLFLAVVSQVWAGFSQSQAELKAE